MPLHFVRNTPLDEILYVLQSHIVYCDVPVDEALYENVQVKFANFDSNPIFESNFKCRYYTIDLKIYVERFVDRYITRLKKMGYFM